MSASSKRVRKQEKRRKSKQREAAREKRQMARAARRSPDEELRFDGPESADGADAWSNPDLPRGMSDLYDGVGESTAQPPKLSEPQEAALGAWWKDYMEADGPARLKMAREVLATVPAGDDWYPHIFPDAVFELESVLPSEQYVALLEELYETRHDVFAMSADWNAHSMVFGCLAQDRLDDVDRVAMTFAAELDKVSDPFFSLMSTIRLAGRADVAQALIDAAVGRLAHSSLMYWAVDEVLSWAMFSHYQRCADAGATDEAIAELHAAAAGLDLDDSEESQTNRRELVLHLAGKSDERWTKDELISSKQKAGRKIFLLGIDYQRWLCGERGFQPIVADQLRRLTQAAIHGINCPFNRLLTGLTRRDFEPYLASKLGFMSLQRIHAPATVVAMKQYYDFLQERELVRPRDWQKSQSVCDQLWQKLQRALKDEWPSYRFLEPLATSDPS